MAKSKKKLIEITGTKLQKTCLLLQFIMLVVMIGSGIYANVNNIESGFIAEIPNYGMYVVLALLLIPTIFQGDK